MNIGFTGTRDGMSEAQYRWTKRLVYHYLGKYATTFFHHGCCVGADAQAHQIVEIMKSDGLVPIEIVAHPPVHSKWRAHLRNIDDERKRKPYLERNKDIVDECDRLIACPAGPEEQRSGTWATIRYARKRRKPITIVWRNGTVTEES